MKEAAYRKEYYSSGRFSQKDAEILGPAIERLAEQSGGRMTAAAVIEEARPDTSPFHPYIEWNDARAAEEHRLSQARHILNGIGVRVVSIKNEVRSAGPIVVNVSTDRQRPVTADGVQRNLGNYVLVSSLKDRPDERRVALEDAKRMLLGSAKRVRILEDLFKSSFKTAPALFAALEAFAEEVETVEVLAKAA